MLEPRKFTPEELAALTAVEKKQENKEFDARKAAAEMALRQWCVERAIEAQLTTESVVIVADNILAFVSEPLK
jgi:hypothetical protein